MAKTLQEFRAEYLRVLEQISEDDPDYIENCMKQFDVQNDIKPEAVPKSRQKKRIA
jgi:hypothetical protein